MKPIAAILVLNSLFFTASATNFTGVKEALFKLGSEYRPVITAKGKEIATEQILKAGKAVSLPSGVLFYAVC
jgi:hypothetical protein